MARGKLYVSLVWLSQPFIFTNKGVEGNGLVKAPHHIGTMMSM